MMKIPCKCDDESINDSADVCYCSEPKSWDKQLKTFIKMHVRWKKRQSSSCQPMEARNETPPAGRKAYDKDALENDQEM